MKIAIDGREANGSDGKARYIREIIKGISKKYAEKHEVVIFSKDKLNFEITDKIGFCYLPKTRYPFSTNIWLRKKLRREKFDLFFAPTGYLPVLFSPVKTVVAIHDLAVYRKDTKPKLKTKLIEKLLLPKTVKKSAGIITPSVSTKNDILDRFGKQHESKIKITPYSMGDEFINLNLKRENFILSVSTLEPRKNFITLLKAYQMLPEKLKEKYHLKIAGNIGWNNQEFENELKKIDTKKYLELLGRIDDEKLIKLYNQATLFVYPSLFEGFGIPVLEAMSCGTPVITTKSSSLPEAGGKAALYIENPKDFKDLAKKIEQVLCDCQLQGKLSLASLEQAKKFSWDKTVVGTIDFFEDVVSKNI